MFITALAVTLAAAAQPDAASVQRVEWPSDLAVASLMAQRSEEAIAVLEKSRLDTPDDAAVLINLGIAYAQLGKEAEARALFTEALGKRGAFELATSSGEFTDSRQLARRAIRMLDRGEFRSSRPNAGLLTLRD